MLNPEWILNFLNDLQEYLHQLNINYQINEDSITLLCLSKEDQNNLLAADLGLGINLIPSLTE